jgi:hypothetical protein
MGMGSVLVRPVSQPQIWSEPGRRTGWYDSIYDEELGSQPCIFTSVTPVRHFYKKYRSCLMRLPIGVE